MFLSTLTSSQPTYIFSNNGPLPVALDEPSYGLVPSYADISLTVSPVTSKNSEEILPQRTPKLWLPSESTDFKLTRHRSSTQTLERARKYHTWTRERVYNKRELWFNSYSDHTEEPYDTDHAKTFRDTINSVVAKLKKDLFDPKKKFSREEQKAIDEWCNNSILLLKLNPCNKNQVDFLINFIRSFNDPSILDGDLDFWSTVNKEMCTIAFNMDRFDQMIQSGSLQRRHVKKYIKGLEKSRQNIVTIKVPGIYVEALGVLIEILRLEIALLQGILDTRPFTETAKALNNKIALSWKTSSSDWKLLWKLSEMNKSLTAKDKKSA